MNYSNFQLQGKRSRQEDAFYIAGDGHLFAVCDGVGGSQDGQLAANMLIEAIGNEYAVSEIQNMENFKSFTTEVVNALWNKTTLDIATTMSLVYLKDNSLYIASIGDTKVFVTDPKTKKWIMTRDHSIVQELFEAGIISTEAEKRTHPMRNRITRAISSVELLEPGDIEFKKIENLSKGSFILLATDGVSEAFDHVELINILLDTQITSTPQKLDIIKQRCLNISKDNSTCVLVEN